MDLLGAKQSHIQHRRGSYRPTDFKRHFALTGRCEIHCPSVDLSVPEYPATSSGQSSMQVEGSGMDYTRTSSE